MEISFLLWACKVLFYATLSPSYEDTFLLDSWVVQMMIFSRTFIFSTKNLYIDGGESGREGWQTSMKSTIAQ